jgi:glycosyltransferase involved in cell wall biosynthesis
MRVALSALLRYIALMAAGRVGLLHVHVAVQRSFLRKAVFLAFAKAGGVPYVIHLHSGRFPEFYRHECGPLGKRVIRFFLSRAGNVVVLSPRWKMLLDGIADGARMTVIPNFAAFPSGGNGLPREPGALLFLGRLTREKGLFDLLRAMALLVPEFPDLRLHVCGDGDQRPVTDLADDLGIRDRDILRGWVEGDAKEEMIDRATIFVLPSYSEGLPMCMLEAMGRGLCVVGTRVGGVPDLVDSGGNGLLVEPGDVKGLASALRLLLSRPDERRRMAEAASRTVSDRFSAHVVLGKLGDLYRQFGIEPRGNAGQAHTGPC